MTDPGIIDLLGAQGWDLFLHMLVLSLMSIGGAIVVAPDMHRYLVDEHAWLSNSEFNSAIALAQSAPGPNLTFIPLLGWMAGMHSAQSLGWPESWHWLMALFGALLVLFAILLPSSILTYSATRWTHRNRDKIPVIAFRQGLLPVVVALMLATAWLMSAHMSLAEGWRAWLLSATVAVAIWKTRVHLLVYLALGGLLGFMGWI